MKHCELRRHVNSKGIHVTQAWLYDTAVHPDSVVDIREGPDWIIRKMVEEIHPGIEYRALDQTRTTTGEDDGG